MRGEWSGGKGPVSRVEDFKSYWNSPLWNKMKSYKFRYDTVTLVGDTHSWNGNISAIAKASPDTDLIFLGDHVLGFGENIYEAIQKTFAHLQECSYRASQKNVHIYWLRGNHDATYDEIWNAEFGSITLIKDHAEGIFPNGKKALLVSGGVSVDRYIRRENYDYWKDEVTTLFDVMGKYDYFIAHDAPEEFNHSTSTLGNNFGWYIERDLTLVDDCLKQRQLISKLAKDSGALQLFSGHFHNSRVEDIGLRKYTCVMCEEHFLVSSLD